MIARPAMRAKLRGGAFEVGDAIDEHWGLAMQVAGEEHPRRSLRQLDHRDTGPHGVDREHEPGPERFGEVRDICSDIPARHVHVVELLEHGPCSLRPSPCAADRFPGGRMSIVTDPEAAAFGLMTLSEG